MQGEFTKEEAQRVIEVACEMFKGIPRTKQPLWLGHLNDVLLFLEAAKKVAPQEVQK